jgi:hypothetical protein
LAANNSFTSPTLPNGERLGESSGPQAASSFLTSAAATPYLPDTIGGPAVAGLVSESSGFEGQSQLDTLEATLPANVYPLSFAGIDSSFIGFDELFVSNLSSNPIPGVGLTISGVGAVSIGTLSPGQSWTTLVPDGQTQGLVTVTTSYSTQQLDTKGLGSQFILGVNGAVDLTVTTSHAGNFRQGDVGDTYTIAASNVGTGPTSGTVTLVDTLPAGLTAIAFSGDGWTTSLATLTATRSDALAAGASYPALTLTVNVATNSPASVTNTVTVSGGGELDTVNNTASDPTTVATNATLATSTAVSTSQGSVTYGTPVTFTATVSSSSTAPAQGRVDFFDATTNTDLGLGTFGSSTGASSTWTLTTGVKAFNVTSGDTITATYGSGTGFTGSSGTTTQTVTPLAITVTAATCTKVYDGTTLAAATPTITSGSLVAGDTAAFTEAFDDKNVHTGKTLTPAGSANDGNGGNNYAVTFVTDTTGQTTPLAITVTAATDTKVYDGTTPSTATPTITADAVVITLAGSAMQTGFSDGAGSGASFNYPFGVAVDSAGNVYVADANNDEIRKITASGVVTTLAGSAGQAGSSDGTGSAARFDYPASVAVDSAGNVYVADLYNDEIREITPSGVVTTLAGSAGQTGSSDGTGSAAGFHQPYGVAVDSVGNVYVADASNDEIRKITPSGVVTTLAGSAGQIGSSNGTGSAARFDFPTGVAVDSVGNVYVADAFNQEIRKITPSGVVATLAGSAGQVGSSDGTGSAARFANPGNVTVDSAGNIYVGDTGTSVIRKISPSGVVSTLAGSAGQRASSDGTGSAARFDDPQGVAVDSMGNVYVGDTYNDEVRKIITANLAPGDTAAFTETFVANSVGTGKTLTPAGSVNDGNGGANYSVTPVTDATGVITKTVDHFLVTTSPTSITAGNNFLLVVTAQDSSNHTVLGYAGTVHFTIPDPLEPAPAGNLAFTPGSGVAFTLATLRTAGSWAVTASDDNYTGTSVPVTVATAPASAVVFIQPPTGASAGATIPVTVEVEDQYGNVISSGSASTSNVRLAIASGPSGGKLLGTTTVQAVAGVATFSNLSIDQAGSYNLTATATGVGGTVASNSFNVAAGRASHLAFTTQPANTPGANVMPSVTVAVEDQYGNTVTTDSSNVTLTLSAAASGGGGALKGTTTVNASGGVAAFSGLSIVDPSNNSYSAAGTRYTLTASDTDNGAALTTGKSAAFNTTLIVNSCTMTPTGFVATFSQPFEMATTPATIGPNLYSAVATNNLPVNVALIGSNEGTERGSLVVNSADTQITFVATTLVNSAGLPIAGVSSPDATSGILAPDGYTVVLDSTSTSFVTTNGQLLDGADSGTGGSNFNQFTAVDNSADVDVVIPSFARGPSSSTVTSTVNVPNASTPIYATTVSKTIASVAEFGAEESGNTVFITTTTSHNLAAGQLVTIAGVGTSGYNGTFYVVSVPNSTTFTYLDPTPHLANSGGGSVISYGGAGLAESGHVVTVATTVPHNLAAGESVTISGAGMSGYNGTFTVLSVPSGTTFTYADSNSGLADSGGGIAALARGIPISLSGPTSGVTSGTFTLTYSSSDLAISGAVVDPSLAASYGATLSLDASSTPGNAIIDFSTTTPLPSASSTPILLGGLTATVPSTAYYKAKELLHFSSVSLNTATGSVAAIGTDALHLVAFPGNASGSGAITSADALDMARVVAAADAGFAAYPLIDPDVIGDLLGDGAVDGPDGALLGRYVNGVTTPQMPTYPGAPVNKLSVTGPTVTASAPSAASAATAVESISVARKVAGTLRVPSALTRSVRSTTVIDPPITSQQAVDGLFTALGRGAADVAALAIAGNRADAAVSQASAAAMSAAGSAQANLDSFLWESEDSSWLDGKHDWLP